MRAWFGLALILAPALLVAGCGSRKSYNGPTVDAFTGRLTHDGKPVSFPEGEAVVLRVFHEKGESFDIPIRADGSFQIGWMPIGKYSATLVRENKQGRGPARRDAVPGGLTIEAGKTEYTIDLGKDWKP